MTLDLMRPDHLEARHRILTWELIRIKEGTLRTWADYGHGQIETTVETRANVEQQLALIQALGGHP